MKKKIISFLMAMMVASSIMPAAVLAEGETSPEIMHFHVWWDDNRNASDKYYYVGMPASGTSIQGNYVDVELNDATSTATGGKIQTREANSNDWSAADWGYIGAAFRYMGQPHQTDAFWGNLYDASDIVDTAYIVAKINPDDISGIDTAYLAVSSANSEWGIEEWVIAHNAGNDLDDITPTNYPDLTGGVKLYNQTVAGAKLTDYYDVAAGGDQTIAVPLSKFVNNPDFLDSYKKATVGGGIYPQYLDGFGFARTDSGEGKVFDIRCTYLGLVNIATPAAPTATLQEDGTVAVSWSATANSDVTYKIDRTKGTTTTTVYEGSETSFVDTLPSSGAYTYTVQLVYTTPDEYKKKNSASSKAGDVVAELAISAASNEILVGEADASKLLLEDFTVIGVSGNDTTVKARPWPFFIGDLRVGSSNGGELQKYRFNYNGYYDRYSSEYHRWWLNDSGYEYPDFTTDQNRGRAITYRPLTEEEGYMAERTSGSNVYKANAYVEHYVKYDDVPKNWGFNGFRYFNRVVADNNQRDLTSYVDNGYILYTINLPQGMNADGLYLAISETTGTWNDNNTDSPWGQVAVGVPLEDYYDVEARGWQTVMVPMSAYNFKDENVFVGAYAGSDGVWFNAYKDYRKYQDTHWDTFTGIGVVRQDVDDAVCEEFYIDVKNLAIVNDLTVAPELTAAFDSETEAVNLEWTESGYTDTTYTITKSNGSETETIDVEGTSYTDADVNSGDYTYTVTSKVGKYEVGKTSAAASVTVEKQEPVDPIVITEVNMEGNGKAWDVVINVYEAAKKYFAKFTDGENVKQGEIIGVGDIESAGSVAFAVLLRTSRTSVALDIIAE